jgi:hypothetical protein
LASIPATGGLQAIIIEWLQAWKNYIADQRHYADIIGPAAVVNGRAVLGEIPETARLAAGAARRQADEQALEADREGANLGLSACRLEQGTS